MNKILLGFDFVTYNGELPNCLDVKFFETIKTASDFDYRFSQEGYIKIWNNEWVVYNSGFYDNCSIKKSIMEIKKYDSNKKWFYIIEPFGNIDNFFGKHHLNFYTSFLLENISSVALHEIKFGNGNLLINYIIDGGLGIRTDNFSKIINFVNEKGIPHNKVYLVFQDFNLKENLKKLNCNFNVINYNYAEYLKSSEFFNTLNIPNWLFWPEDTYDPQYGKVGKPKSSVTHKDEFLNSIGNNKKDFLFLCRQWKKHRIHILDILYNLGFENNLISYDNKFYSDWEVSRYYEDGFNFEMIEKIKNSSSFLDIKEMNKIAGYGYEDKELYLNTYISIVAESIFFQVDTNFPAGYLSEKIWKPIGHAQPFILAGPAHSLKYLHEIGYKSFHPFIDESYDEEEDDLKRLFMILNQIEIFSKKSKEEKDEFLKNVADIVVENQEKFLQVSQQNQHTEILKQLI